ncbi:MAG: hypothetical protein DWH91_10970 [Planctomycetota bacterium]|nr:MAG: hypothetical protein DWH91_10970 [Planctomycetota bacterium]
MPRKGRLVQPRHIFPWIAAPWIELLRVLWRIERFFLTPIRYLQAWTISAMFGVLGVILSVALFIPRLTESGLHASTAPSGAGVPAYEMPYIPPEAPEYVPTGSAAVSARLQRTWVPYFDQMEIVETRSQVQPSDLRALLANRDPWRDRKTFGGHAPERERPIEPYTYHARVRRETIAPAIPEYHPEDSNLQSHAAQRTASLLIEKEVPVVAEPGEPFTYFLVVRNQTSETIESAIVRETVTDIDRIIDVDPPAEIAPNFGHLIWDLHQLQPKEARRLRITIQPQAVAELALVSEVQIISAPVVGETLVNAKQTPGPVLPVDRVIPEMQPVEPTITPEPVVRKPVTGAPRLALQFEPQKDVVAVGDEINAYYTITNVGTADAHDVLLLVAVPPQLRHRFGNLVQHKIKLLKPNEERRALFAAIIEEGGRIPVEWALSSQEVVEKQSVEWLVAESAPVPSIPDRGLAGPASGRSSIPAGATTPDTRLRPEPDLRPIPDPEMNTPPSSIGGVRERSAPTVPPEGLPGPAPEPLRPLREPASGPSVAPEGLWGPDELRGNGQHRDLPIVPELMPDELSPRGDSSGTGSSIPGRNSIPHGSSIPAGDLSEPPLEGFNPGGLETGLPEPELSPSLPKEFPTEDPGPASDTKIQ